MYTCICNSFYLKIWQIYSFVICFILLRPKGQRKNHCSSSLGLALWVTAARYNGSLEEQKSEECLALFALYIFTGHVENSGTAYILGLLSSTFRTTFPVLVFVCPSLYSRYSTFKFESSCRVISPQHNNLCYSHRPH